MSKAMGTIGKVMRRTRTVMIETTTEQCAAEFHRLFGMRDGDYIEFDRRTSAGEKPTVARILSVEECFYNSGGGYTAYVKVAPLLVGGRVGNTMSVGICCDEDGSNFRGIGGNRVKRVAAPEKAGK